MAEAKKSGATLQDIADAVGVSVATVSRALNDSDKINPATKQAVRDEAAAQNYELRKPRQQLRTGPTIALVIPTPQGQDSRISEPFFLDLIGGIGDAMKEAECDFLISHLSPSDEDGLHRLGREIRADGIIVIGQGRLHQGLNRLANGRLPLLVWGATLPDQDYCVVGSDNMLGGKRATGHLIRLGRSRIAFLGDTAAPEIALRHQGYLAALKGAGLQPDPALHLACGLHLDDGQDAINAMLERGIPVDGVFCGNDIVAIGAIRALARAGKSVPTDVSVVGYDDVRMAGYSNPALTTIRQDVGKAGRLLVRKVLNLLNGMPCRTELLPTELIVRESCGG